MLPLDDKCLHGKLENGLTYYVQSNEKPKARAELRLVVKVGSVFETEEECGIAHMVEHLAFRGTAKFDSFAVVRFLETIGAKFGACQNAYTNFDETVCVETHMPPQTLLWRLVRAARDGPCGTRWCGRHVVVCAACDAAQVGSLVASVSLSRCRWSTGPAGMGGGGPRVQKGQPEATWLTTRFWVGAGVCQNA